MKRLLALLFLLLPTAAIGQDYATAFAKLDSVWIGPDFTPAATTAVDDEVGTWHGDLDGTSPANTEDIDEAGPLPHLPYSLHFDPANGDRIDLDTSHTGLTNFSLVFWAKRDVTNSFHGAIGYDGANRIRFPNNSTQITGEIGGSSFATTHGVDTTAWHHYGITRNATTGDVVVYVDGSAVETHTALDTDNYAISAIAAQVPAATNPIDGSMSEVGYADEVLTATDMAQLYAGPSGGDPNPLTPTIPGGTPDPLKRILP